MTFRKKLVFSAITVFIFFLILLLVLELFLHIYISFTRGELALISNPELGWAVKPNFHSERTISSYGGYKKYPVKITTNELGFRKWGNPDSKKTKIFIVGDSLTHSMYASDDKTWYSIFGERTEAEVFTYGCSGYGTIQQYLIIKRYFNLIKPDKVIIAFTSNDFDNNIDTGNYDPIENAFGRPYFILDLKNTNNIGDEVPIKNPNTVPHIKLKRSNIKTFLCANSYLAYFIITRLGEIKRKYAKEKTPEEIEQNYEQSIMRTKIALNAVKTFLPDKTELFLFDFTCDSKAHKNLKQMCDELNIKLISGVDQKIIETDQGKKLMRAPDGSHLNEDGERIVGEWLAEYFLHL